MKIIEQQQQQLVLEGNAYHNFVDTIKSKRTLDEYRHGIMRFMRFQVTDVNNLILFDSKEAQQKIIECIGYLKREQKIAAVTINLYVASVMHFYAMNDITLNRKRIGRFIPEKIKINKDRAYTREEISKILDFCDIRSTNPNNDYVWQYHIQNLGNRWSPPPVTTTQPNSPSS